MVVIVVLAALARSLIALSCVEVPARLALRGVRKSNFPSCGLHCFVRECCACVQCLPDSRSLGCGSRDPDLRQTCCDENVLLDLHCGGGTFTVESGSHHWCANIAAHFVRQLQFCERVFFGVDLLML